MFDEPWGRRKVLTMLEGRLLAVPKTDEGDGGEFDVPRQSWYQQRCAAYDHGDPEQILDCVQYEGAIDQIDDMRVRAAMILRSWGLEYADIGALLGGRGERRTGREMVMQGLKIVVAGEGRRAG